MSIKPLQQAGDTIVEVLIVIIVLGTVVAAGYGIATRSLQSTQLAQEKTYALKLAEGQLESLKAAAEQNPAILANTNGFCLNGTTSTDINGGSPTSTMASEIYANYPNECKKDPNNQNCASYCYHYGIKRVGDNSFTATVRWDGPAASKQQIELSYRVYE